MTTKYHLVILLACMLPCSCIEFFPGQQFETEKCYRNGDYEIRVDFKTNYSSLFTEFGTKLCDTVTCRDDKSNIIECKSITKSVSCFIVSIYPYWEYSNLPEVYKHYYLYGRNDSGWFFISEAVNKFWGCQLKVCDNVLPLLEIQRIEHGSRLVEITFSNVLSKSDERYDDRIVNVTIGNNDANKSVVIASRGFSHNDIPTNISGTIPNVCGNFSEICIHNGFKYCGVNNTQLEKFVKSCSATTPYYILPSSFSGRCSKSEVQIDLDITLSKKKSKAPIYLNYTFLDRNGRIIDTINESKLFKSFPDPRQEIFVVNATLCNKCHCSIPIQVGCGRLQSGSGKFLPTWQLVLISFVAVALLSCTSAIIYFIYLRKKSNNMVGKENYEDWIKPNITDKYYYIPQPVNGYDKPDIKAEEDHHDTKNVYNVYSE